MRWHWTKVVKSFIFLAISVVSLNILLLLQSPFDKISYNPSEITTAARLGEVPPQTTKPPPKLNSTVVCPGVQMGQIKDMGQFQRVLGSTLVVYSAFLDHDTVRIVGLYDRHVPITDIHCRLWYHHRSGDPLSVVPARVGKMPEDHDRKFTSAFVHCQLPVELWGVQPSAVSVVTVPCTQQPLNILAISRPVAGDEVSKFTVCVTPLNYRYSRAFELVEMVELNKLLGAQKVVFYNHTTGPNVDQVLEMYSRLGEVDVWPWHLPMTTDTWPPLGAPEIHYFAQMAALNDCLYRYRNQSEYIVFTDLDEFVIPRKADNWTQLISERENGQPHVAVFHIKSVFFRKEWPVPTESFRKTVENYKSVILACTWREVRYLPHGTRSKYIVNPRLTEIVGIHSVWKAFGEVDRVDEKVASVHHYRNWNEPNDPVPRVQDDVAVRKYGSRLAERLERVWSTLKGVPLDIDLKTYGDRV